VTYFILLTSLYSTKYGWIRIQFTESGFRGGLDASPKGNWIRLLLAPKWHLLWMEQIRVLWTQLLDLFVEQSAQISYRIPLLSKVRPVFYFTHAIQPSLWLLFFLASTFKTIWLESYKLMATKSYNLMAQKLQVLSPKITI